MLDKLAVLQDRSVMLKTCREFFYGRGLTEVDCPALSPFASIDEHIDLVPVTVKSSFSAYLFSSPEHLMKRLLSEGLGDSFQLSHVYRDHEQGDSHQIEFMMAEWYRLGMTFREIIAETLEFCFLFLPHRDVEVISYRDAFIRFAKMDPYESTVSEVLQHIDNLGLKPYEGIENEGKDALLIYLLAELVEPHFVGEKFWVLQHYPSSQAALAQVSEIEGYPVASRFEVYFQGVELANGYEELTNPKVQRERYEAENIKRVQGGKCPYPMDEKFIQALTKGLPPCCGVAVGFDRLMMLRHGSRRIHDVISFSFDHEWTKV